ncbi:hypothetical protein SY89_02689 [Halolamina pelagica]|uniref:Uncharacterized protein n=1 Tax=Halolamina pelagica TaxID=699431 RepID=A0A0P7HE29_9EURY|nr:hypothetical protein [Halolamina pelagica]KPN31932.1 hypothetical protein SY89_02689 [Halolamina pelagica]
MSTEEKSNGELFTGPDVLETDTTSERREVPVETLCDGQFEYAKIRLNSRMLRELGVPYGVTAISVNVGENGLVIEPAGA